MKPYCPVCVLLIIMSFPLPALDTGPKTSVSKLYSGTYETSHEPDENAVYGVPSLGLSSQGRQVIEAFALIRDTSGTLTRSAAEIQFRNGSFELISQSGLSLFNTGSQVYWLAIQAKNPSQTILNRYLLVEGTLLDRVHFYQLRGHANNRSTWYWEESGGELPFDLRPIPVRPLVFDAQLPADLNSVIMIRIQHRGPFTISFSLLEDTQFMGNLENQNFILAMTLGAMFLMVAYTLLLFSTLHDRVFLWLILHLVAVVFFVIVKDGFAFKYLWPDFPELNYHTGPFSTALIFLSTWFFTQSLFGQGNNNRQAKFLVLGFFTGVFILMTSLSSNQLVALGALIVYTGIVLTLVLKDCAWAIGNERPEGHMVLAGVLILVLGFILAQLPLIFKLAPGFLRDFLSRADHIGIIVEAMLLAFVLSGRLNLLKQERDKAEEKNRLKQSFIANMSHEMRTPLNAIIGFSEAIGRSNLLGEIHGYNKRILKESDSLLFQINQVLDLAKIEANRLEVLNEAFNLHDSLDFLFDSYCQRALEKDIHLQIKAPERKYCRVISDRNRIEQVLRNLLDNAIKFTPRGAVTIRLDLEKLRDGVIRANFAVIDTGIGIDAEKLKTIFDEFEQGDSSITKRFGGTGLGTSIARRIVSVMGGAIHARSIPGTGSTFEFSLNLESVPDISSEIQPRPPLDLEQIGTKSSAEKKRILVVDDFETNRQIVCIHLKNAPVHIDCAVNGEEALALLEKTSYHLVLLDIFMPGLSGYDVVRAIRAKEQIKDIPVLGLTASGYDQDIKDAIEAGMDDVLTKPVKRAELLEKIGEYLWTGEESTR